MTHCRREGDARAICIERFDDEDVRQVHTAIEGVIHDEDVAWPHVVPELPHDRLERRGNRPEMAGERQPLRDQLAVGVGQRGREVHIVLQHAGVGGTHDGQGHLIGDGKNRILEQLEGNRVCDFRHPYVSLGRCTCGHTAMRQHEFSPLTCILPHTGGGGEPGRPTPPHPYPGAYAPQVRGHCSRQSVQCAALTSSAPGYISGRSASRHSTPLGRMRSTARAW